MQSTWQEAGFQEGINLIKPCWQHTELQGYEVREYFVLCLPQKSVYTFISNNGKLISM